MASQLTSTTERRSVTRSPVVENSVVAKESDGSKGTSDRKLGGMTLAEVKEQLQTNLTQLERLRGGPRTEAHRKIKELRELKIRNLQRNQDRDAEEKSLLQNLHQLQAKHQSDMQVSVAQEQAYQSFRTLNRGHLQQIEQEKRQELEGLSNESSLLEQQERKIHEDIDKLHKGLLHSKRVHLQSHSSSVTAEGQASIQTAEENPKKQDGARQARLARQREKIAHLALEQGQKIAELELQRKQLEEQQAGIRDQLPAESQSVSVRTSKRLQTPFLDKLRHEKIYGEARVRELKQRMRDEEDRQRRQMEETMNGLELDKPLTPLKSGRLHKARSPGMTELVDKGLADDKQADTAPAVGDESLMAAIRELRRSYLTTGGKDRSILHKIQQLEQRAAYQQPLSQQPPPLQTSPPINWPYFPVHPVGDIQSQQSWHLIQQVQAQNAKLMEEINQKEQRGLKNPQVDTSMYHLEIEKQKELMRMKYETEMARQKAEMARIELEMKRDRERLRPTEGRTELIPQHTAVTARLEPSPYDPRGGFAIFWDFAVGLSASYSKVNLVTATISKSGRKSHSKGLPLAHCSAPVEPITIPGNVAVMALKQSYPRFSASVDNAVIVELQATIGGSSKTVSSGHQKAVGWTKIGLFDQFSRVLSGRWKLPIRSSPVQEDISLNELNRVPQVGQVELFLRIINARDVDLQSQVRMEPHLHQGLYKYPVPTVIVSMADDVSFHGSVGISALPSSHSRQITPSSQMHNVSTKPPSETEFPPGTPEAVEDESRPGSEGEVAETVGFQIERIRGVWPGVAVLKLRSYMASGKPVATLSGEDLVWESSTTKSNFLSGVHEFGHQKALFDQVVLHRDSIVMVELWIGKRVRELLNEQDNEADKEENKPSSEEQDQLDDYEKDLEEEADSDSPEKVRRRGVRIVYEEQKLVGWSAFRLVKLTEMESEEEDNEENKLTINDGFHRLPLFKAETMPNPADVVLPILGSADEPYDRFGDATVKLKVYSDVLPRSDSPASEISELRPISPPYEAWIPNQRQTPPSTRFIPGDGFDFWIDGARFLPDIVTATRVSGRIFNHKYIKVGGKVDISTDIDLDSSIYNPCYNYCVQIREERLPPTSTILLKMYTRCQRTKELAIIGFSVLNVFVSSGTDQQPATDSSAIPISLNEGNHQIRIKRFLPKLLVNMNASLLDDTPNVPCASLLVRLVHVPSDGQHHTRSPLTAEQGQSSPLPDYADGIYDSMQCKPTKGESRLLADMCTRPVLSVRDSMPLFGDGIEKRQRDDNGRRQWIAKRLWRLQEDSPVEIDLTYLARYTAHCGVQFALESAQNLPWSKLTQCIFCFAPPASFYSGHTDDLVSRTKSIEWSSHQKCPEWKDGFQYFGRRRLHRHLVVLIHLFAVDVGRRRRMKVADEAWSALEVFSEGYVYTNRYQLPLYEGKPSKIVFDYLKHYPASTALNDLVGQRKIRRLDGASVFVRIADGRRHEEVPLTQEVNLDYLPEERRSRYTNVHGHQKLLSELIPKDANQNEYEQKAATQFDELLTLLLNKNKAK